MENKGKIKDWFMEYVANNYSYNTWTPKKEIEAMNANPYWINGNVDEYECLRILQRVVQYHAQP